MTMSFKMYHIVCDNDDVYSHNNFDDDVDVTFDDGADADGPR